MNSFMISQAQQRTFGTGLNFSRKIGKHFHVNLGLSVEDTALKDLSGNYLYTGQSILGNMTMRAVETGMANSALGGYEVARSARNTQLQGGAYFNVAPSISYDTRDQRVDPHSGTLVKLTASPSLGLTNASFVKLGISASQFVPLSKETTLALNAQAGTSFGDVPAFAQYRLGGWNGMRGYRQFSDLGTGTSMLMATAEVRRRLLPHSHNKVMKAIGDHVKGAVFMDIGQISGNGTINSLMSESNMGASVGFGLRINVPMIGLVRIDYGLPLVSTLMGHMTPRITIGFGDKF
jgi:outer membrane protein assembly factor BamA